jgi:hypothetical protein
MIKKYGYLVLGNELKLATNILKNQITNEFNMVSHKVIFEKAGINVIEELSKPTTLPIMFASNESRVIYMKLDNENDTFLPFVASHNIVLQPKTEEARKMQEEAKKFTLESETIIDEYISDKFSKELANRNNIGSLFDKVEKLKDINVLPDGEKREEFLQMIDGFTFKEEISYIISEKDRKFSEYKSIINGLKFIDKIVDLDKSKIKENRSFNELIDIYKEASNRLKELPDTDKIKDELIKDQSHYVKRVVVTKIDINRDILKSDNIENHPFVFKETDYSKLFSIAKDRLEKDELKEEFVVEQASQYFCKDALNSRDEILLFEKEIIRNRERANIFPSLKMADEDKIKSNIVESKIDLTLQETNKRAFSLSNLS